MAHLHSIYDTDPHFSIDPVTRAIKNESTRKTALVQGDHNSERFTFEVPRFVEGHDMSLSTRIEVHFINFAADKSGQSENVYIVDDMQISPNSEDESIVIFSWLLSTNATTYNGTLAFAIRFVCLTDEKIDYAWHTAPYKGISISEGINNGEKVIEDNSDILAAWERDINELAWRVENLEKNGGGGGEGSSVEIVQEMGESTTAVMSQKAVYDMWDGMENQIGQNYDQIDNLWNDQGWQNERHDELVSRVEALENSGGGSGGGSGSDSGGWQAGYVAGAQEYIVNAYPAFYGDNGEIDAGNIHAENVYVPLMGREDCRVYVAMCDFNTNKIVGAAFVMFYDYGNGIEGYVENNRFGIAEDSTCSGDIGCAVLYSR